MPLAVDLSNFLGLNGFWSGVLDPSALDRLADSARRFDSAKQARDAMEALQGEVIKEAKAEEMERLAEGDAFLFLESKWHIQEIEGLVDLRLAELRGDPYGGPGAELPPGLSIFLRIDRERLTPQGQRRLLGGEKKVGVFASVGSFAESQLTLSPIAVFARYAAQ